MSYYYDPFRRKYSKGRKNFDLRSTFKEFNPFRPRTELQRKRMQIRDNYYKGKAAENQAILRDQLRGWEIQRTGRGSDYIRIKRDFWSRRVIKTEKVEVKSSPTAPLRPLQKKEKTKSRNYKVQREDVLFW